MKKSISAFLEKFRRITSTASYMPEVDGLRFIAIFWVVVWMHTSNFVNVKFYDHKLFSTYIIRVILEGNHGVSLFFMISGFILGLPFARQYLQGQGKVSLKNYYIRRITRLEPPYITALLIAFAGLIYFKNYSITTLLPHLGASVIYAHKIIYGTKSTVLGVAWSLEIEAQYYVLAPFLAFLFKIEKKSLRYPVFIFLIIFFTAVAFTDIYRYNRLPGILTSLECFLTGMFLCDLYVNNVSLPGNKSAWCVAGIAIFILSPFLLSLYVFFPYLVKLLLMGLLFYIGITNPGMKKILSIQWITIIGGMCYSIYLLQFVIMSGVFPVLAKLQFTNQWVGFLAYSGIIIILVLAGSMIFYKLIEQPCMRKEWYKGIFKKRQTKVVR
ncbi:MAG: acyltransferase [Bacteroidota bacterium]